MALRSAPSATMTQDAGRGGRALQQHWKGRATGFLLLKGHSTGTPVRTVAGREGELLPGQ